MRWFNFIDLILIIAVASITAVINYLIQSWFFYTDITAIDRLFNSAKKQSFLSYSITVSSELSYLMIIRSEMSF